MILKIYTYPEQVLRRKAKPVPLLTSPTQDKSVDDGVEVVTWPAELLQLGRDMVETMYASQGIGLAAPQVGQSVRLIVVDTRPRDEEGRYVNKEQTELEAKVSQPMILFNPEIIQKRGKTSYEEGCLSVPTFFETVERFEWIEVKAWDIEGKPLRFETDGLLSICIQHEIDHLDGKLFIDRLSLIKSNRIKKRIEKEGYPDREEASAERQKS